MSSVTSTFVYDANKPNINWLGPQTSDQTQLIAQQAMPASRQTPTLINTLKQKVTNPQKTLW